MRVYTSYYGNPLLRKIDRSRLVQISVQLPKWWQPIREMRQLYPRWNMLKMDEATYRPEYEKILEKVRLDHLQLKEGDILLCWEKPEDFCHRHMVAEWLRNQGIECWEFGESDLSLSKITEKSVVKMKKFDLQLKLLTSD